MKHVTLGNGQTMELATPGRRLMARIFDLFLLMICVGVVGMVTGAAATPMASTSGGDQSNGGLIVASIVAVVLVVAF